MTALLPWIVGVIVLLAVWIAGVAWIDSAED
jgi:hypothetical protein